MVSTNKCCKVNVIVYSNLKEVGAKVLYTIIENKHVHSHSHSNHITFVGVSFSTAELVHQSVSV